MFFATLGHLRLVGEDFSSKKKSTTKSHVSLKFKTLEEEKDEPKAVRVHVSTT